jgi:enoyl-CoA hydratase
MCRASPTSLVVTFEAFKRGSRLSLGDALCMEFRIACRLTMRSTDFHEGVRCRLIDRHSTPTWKPSDLDGVDKQAVIQRYFEPFLPGEEVELNVNDQAKHMAMAVTSKL